MKPVIGLILLGSLSACIPAAGVRPLILTEIHLRMGAQNLYGVLLSGNLTEVEIPAVKERIVPIRESEDRFFPTSQSGTPQDPIVSRWLYSDTWHVQCDNEWRSQSPLIGFLTVVDMEAIRRFIQARLKEFIVEEHREPFLESLEYRLAEPDVPLVAVQSSITIRAPSAAELGRPKSKSDLLCSNLGAS